MVIAARYIGALIGSNNVQATTLHRFTLLDTSLNGSSGFFRLGLAFEKGDVPSGNVPVVKLTDGTLVRSAVMETNIWSDGSLRKATLVGEVPDGVLLAATIEVTMAPGSQATSGIDPFAYLTANTDFKVQVTNHSGAVSGNLPNRTYLFNTAFSTTSRREIQADNPVCVRVFAWGAPAGEKHLMCLHYVDLWLDQFGQVAGVEWTPVMSQHWWIDDPFGDGASPKEERSYDAVLFNGATELEGFAGLNHAYYCQWAGLYTGNDAQHARRLWIDMGSPMPTLRLAYSPDSKRRLMRTGYIPPLNQAARYTVEHGETYEALGLNNHRAGINGTGGYQGRGILTNMDSIALIEQTAERWRAARVSAQASLSVFHHIKDHRPAVGGPFDGDASMGMFPQKIERFGAQTYPGLAAETIAVTGLNSEINDVPPSAATSSPHATGSFTAWDDAHHTVYAFMMAFVEGERYLADAVLDQFSYLNMQNAFDGFVSDPPAIWGLDSPRRDLLNVPPTPTYGFTHIRHRQERSFGWSQYSWDHVYALVADADRHKPFLLNLQQTASDLLNDSIAFFPPSQLETGTYWMRNKPVIANFMHGMAAQMFERSNLLTENAYEGHVNFADLTVRYLRDTLIHNPYASRFQTQLVCVDDKNATQYIERDERFVEAKGVVDNSGASGTVFIANNAFFTGVLPANGDACYVSDPTGADPLPPELDVATLYFLINVTITGSNDATWQLATTPGGSPITVTTPANPTADPVRHYVKMSAFSSLSVVGQNGAVVPADDDFMTINHAAVEYHYGTNGSEVTSADIAAIRAFFAPKTYSVFANWNLNGDLLR